MLRAYSILFLIFITVGCTNSVQKSISSSIVANKNARNALEWGSSSENPEILFKRLREEFLENKKIENDVCNELMSITGQELSIFEEEINRSANKDLLNNCKTQLLKKLEDYWDTQRKELDSAGLNFHFQTRIEKRDLSKGYRAATGDVLTKELILTFDDGPHPHYTALILNILKRVQAKVMFFSLGAHVSENPGVLRQAALNGHIMGSHSQTHRCLAANDICAKANKGVPLASAEAIAEIRGGHQAVFNSIGFVDPFFRFPYGESDPVLVKYLADRQVAQMYWSIDSMDWKAQSNSVLLMGVLNQIDKNQRGIVLFHDIQRRTLEILPEFLKSIYERGYTLVILQSLDDGARDNSQLVTKAPGFP